MKRSLKWLILLTALVMTLSFGLFATACFGKVTLSFDAGEGTPVENISAEPGAEVELPLSLRKGYALVGWSTEQGGTPLTGSVTAPEKDTVYYAVWAEGYEVNFDAADGVFAEGAPDPLTLAAGANLYDAVKDIMPTKSGLIFGAWFLGDEEIGGGAKMPAENITLTARYKVEYTMETYLANLAGTSYVPGGEFFYGTDYVGATVSPSAPAQDGFLPTSSPQGADPVESIRLDADASRNILKFYYERRTCTVIFQPDAPLATGEVPTVSALFGSTVTVPENSFRLNGYRFAGWGLFGGGETEYLPDTPFIVTGDMVLYAIWDRGFTDRYGGEDLVFFPRGDEDKAILRRGEMEFEGVRTGDSFSFTPPSGDVLEGKVYGTMYSYRRADLAGEYIFYANTPDPAFPEEELYNENRTLTIDEFLNATYRNGSRVYAGSVAFDEERGDYLFTGDGTEFHFLPAQGDQYRYERVFSVGGDEMGGYIDFVMVDPSTGMGYVANSMVLVLDGYSTAALLDATNYLTYDGRYYVEGTYLKGTVELYKIVCFFEDPNGYLGSTGGIALNYIYTIPIDEDPEFDGYVEANAFRGEYEDADGNTLVLDGFGIFADSAVYTENGVVYKGMYTLSTDLVAGSVVDITTEQGRSFSFLLDSAEGSFSVPRQLGDGSYTEFRFMDGNTLRPPFLILYDTDVMSGNEPLGKRTDVYVPTEDGSDIVKAASGYCTVEAIGIGSRFSLYHFVRTDVVEGYESQTPEKLTFYDSMVTSTIDFMSYNIYCVLEQTTDGNLTSYWSKYSLDDGGQIWTCSSVTAGGLGSLYINSRGGVTEGQFEIGANEHFDGILGTFLYATESGDLVELYFDLFASDDGTGRAVPRAGVESMLYVILPTGEGSGVGRQMIFLDGVSRMKYTEDNGANFREGTYLRVDETCFGEAVYSFQVNGKEEFRFTPYTLSVYGDTLLAALYDSDFEQVLGEPVGGLTFAGAGSLRIDGYHRATLSSESGETLRGTYVRDELMQTVIFTTDGGTEYVLELDLSKKSFVRLDWASGRRWTLCDSDLNPINNYYAEFVDGGAEKTVRIKNAAGTVYSEGRYVPLGTVSATGYEEYLLRGVTLGMNYPLGNYRVTFAMGGGSNGDQNACLVYDSKASGVFTDENWNVLVLDGYGSGAFYTEAFSGNGTYSVIDRKKHFISFEMEDNASAAAGQTFYLLVESNTFFMNDYEALSGVFFSDEMESIVFGSDGTAYLGASSGTYYVRNGKAYIYIGDTPTIVDAPDGDVYTYNGKTYRRWDGKEMVMTGTVRMLGEKGEPTPDHPDLTATLSFTPNRTTNSKRPTLFTFEGHTGEDGKPTVYDGYAISLYAAGSDPMSGSAGRFSPTVTYGNSSYPIAFSYADGKYSFTVTAGYNKLEYLDHNARYEPDISVPRGGRLFKTSFGFGAIELEKTTLSGDFLYLYKAGDAVYGKPLHFDGVEEESVKTVGYVPKYGDRLEIEFEASDGNRYLLNYYEYYEGGLYFWCYGLFSYQDVEAEGYTVRAKTLLYTKMSIAPGYLDAQDGSGKAIGKISAVTLTETGAAAPIVAYDTGITPKGYNNGVWLVDRADVTEHGSTNTCTWGKGYLVTFSFAQDGKTVTAAKVESYEFVQVVNYMQNLINLFIDGEGNIVLAGLLVYNPDFGRYDFAGDPHDLKELGKGVFSFRATWDGTELLYTVTVSAADNVVFTDGDGKQVTKPGYTVTVTTVQ